MTTAVEIQSILLRRDAATFKVQSIPVPSMEIIHPLLANALSSLQQGNMEEAEKAFAEAAAACVQKFGENDIVTARTLAHLARVCASRDKVDLAVQMYERILRIHESLPMQSSSDHAIAMRDLAELRAMGGFYDAALDLRCRADGIMEDMRARLEAMESSSKSSDEESDEAINNEVGSREDGSGDNDSSDISDNELLDHSGTLRPSTERSDGNK